MLYNYINVYYSAFSVIAAHFFDQFNLNPTPPPLSPHPGSSQEEVPGRPPWSWEPEHTFSLHLSDPLMVHAAYASSSQSYCQSYSQSSRRSGGDCRPPPPPQQQASAAAVQCLAQIQSQSQVQIQAQIQARIHLPGRHPAANPLQQGTTPSPRSC